MVFDFQKLFVSVRNEGEAAIVIRKIKSLTCTRSLNRNVMFRVTGRGIEGEAWLEKKRIV